MQKKGRLIINASIVFGILAAFWQLWLLNEQIKIAKVQNELLKRSVDQVDSSLALYAEDVGLKKVERNQVSIQIAQESTRARQEFAQYFSDNKPTLAIYQPNCSVRGTTKIFTVTIKNIGKATASETVVRADWSTRTGGPIYSKSGKPTEWPSDFPAVWILAEETIKNCDVWCKITVTWNWKDGSISVPFSLVKYFWCEDCPDSDCSCFETDSEKWNLRVGK